MRDLKMISPFNRALQGIRSPFGARAGGPVATYYVNGSTGSDSDNGSTDPLAFLTLAKLVTVIGSTLNVLGNVAGAQTYREALSCTTAYTRIDGYSGLATIDGSDAISGWTAEGTANVWQKSITFEATATGRMRVFDTAGVELTRVADVATCSTTAGSYVDPGSLASSPKTIKVRPRGGDANPDGYFVTVRGTGVYLPGDNVRLSDVIAKNVLSNNGAIELGLNALGERLLAVNGTKHNFLINSGTLRNCIACRSDAPTVAEPSETCFVAYVGDPTGKSVVFERCYAVRDGGSTGNTVLNAHGTYPNNYASMTLRQFAQIGYEVSGTPSALTVLNEGFHGKDMLSWAAHYADNATYRNFLFSLKTNHNGSLFNPLSTVGTWLFEHGAIHSLGSNNGVFRLRSAYNGVTLVLRNLVINFTAFANLMSSEGMSSGTIKMYDCIVVAIGVVANAVLIPNGVNYEGDRNVFVGSSIYNTYHGTFYLTTNLAAWRTLTGQDANSVSYTDAQGATLWNGDPANGDFRLKSTGTGAAVAALLAGPQTKWDYNNTVAVSGAPSGWPTMPSTLAECETFVGNPTGWVH